MSMLLGGGVWLLGFCLLSPVRFKADSDAAGAKATFSSLLQPDPPASPREGNGGIAEMSKVSSKDSRKAKRGDGAPQPKSESSVSSEFTNGGDEGENTRSPV